MGNSALERRGSEGAKHKVTIACRQSFDKGLCMTQMWYALHALNDSEAVEGYKRTARKLG